MDSSVWKRNISMLDITLRTHFPSTIYSSNQTGPLYYLQGDPLTIKLHKPDMRFFCLSEAVSLAMRSHNSCQMSRYFALILHMIQHTIFLDWIFLPPTQPISLHQTNRTMGDLNHLITLSHLNALNHLNTSNPFKNLNNLNHFKHFKHSHF